MARMSRPLRGIADTLRRPESSPFNSRLARLVMVCCCLAIGHWGSAVVAAAQAAPPLLTNTVNDFAGIVDSASRSELDRRIRALREATGDTIVIATVPTFKPYGSIEEYAVKMFENGGRGIGDKDKHNGLLILVARDDRALRLEVGYGLEPFVPDGFAGEVRDVIRPKFREGQFGEGLLAGTTRLINRISEKRGVAVPDVPADRTPASAPASSRFPLGLIFWIVVAIIVFSRNGRRRRRRYWGSGPWSNWTGGVGGFGGGGFGGGGFGGFGGGGGGGFGGFGGGGSGGGGASGNW
jgi:uncharacterized protein